MRKELGKITSVRLGKGGYDDAMFGISFVLSGDGWGVSDFWGTWATRSESAKFSLEDWMNSTQEAYFKLKDLMSKAKVDDFNKLQGIPIEATFEGNLLRGWRVLVEVL